MPSTRKNGYGSEHQRLRAKWQREIDQFGAECCEDVCLMPTRTIMRGDRSWHLAHAAGQQGYKGPAHSKCNLVEQNCRRVGKQVRPQSRQW